MTGYLVICFDDDGDYVLATRQQFADAKSAQRYADTLAPARWPMVIGLPFPTKIERLD